MSHEYRDIGDRASTPCDKENAHGVAIIVNAAGYETTLIPFRHPVLLDNEIRIRVTHSGLCQSDTMMMKNDWGMSHFPMVPGHEILGVVTHIGEKVTKFQVGDRVGHGPQRDCCESCYQCLTGNNNLCPTGELTIGAHYGGWATSFQSKANSFVRVGDQLPGTAAPLFCAGVTVYSPMHRDLVPGMKVGIVGIGGLGHLGITMANRMGCEVTAISTSPDKEAESKELGAHHFLNSRDEAALKEAKNSLDYILNTATAHEFSMNFGLLKPRGVLNVVGAPEISGFNQPFYAQSLIFKELTIKASAAGSRIEMESMLDFCTLHSIYPRSEVYQFTEADKAIESLAKSKPRAPRYRAVFDTASFFETFTPSN